MTTKRIEIGQRPAVGTDAENWVQRGDAANVGESPRGTLYPARLTIDVSVDLRGRIKVAAFRRGLTVADMLRDLFERQFPKSESNS
jgi:hypothetical protein